MDTREFERLLEQTLADARLSRGEKSTLRQWLDDWQPGAEELRECRRRAFELAARSVTGAQNRNVLDWLRDVVQLLQPDPQTFCAPYAGEAWFSPEQDCPARIAQLFDGATAAVDVCVFTITDDRISKALLAAHRRGVKLRLITDDQKSGDRGSDVDRFRKAGIAVCTDRTRHHMHHKFAIFDNRLLLNGSYNWTRSAADFNQENFTITPAAALIEKFSACFEKLWRELA